VSEDYKLTGKPFIVTMGYAPIPNTVLSPRDIGTFETRSKLTKFINKNRDGHGREVACLDLDDAMRVVEAFTIPVQSIWFKRVHELKPKGIPVKEHFWKTGIKLKE